MAAYVVVPGHEPTQTVGSQTWTFTPPKIAAVRDML